jgi:hypothetical protein
VKQAAKNVAASVRQRLLNRARAEGRPFGEVLQYFAMERFLYRLAKSRHAQQFVLKGALMLKVWNASKMRSTMDIDLLGRADNDVEAMNGVVREICETPVEIDDGLIFDTGSLSGERITEAAEYQGVRLRFEATLGVAKVPMQVDVGFGDIVSPAIAPITYPTILDLPAPQLLAYTQESAIAEKFEAMVKLGELNSRMKDFFDIWAMSSEFDFDGSKLRAAIAATFRRRGTPIPSGIPTALTDDFASNAQKQIQWRGFARRIRLAGLPSLLEVISRLRGFLIPVLVSKESDPKWIAAAGEWTNRRD